MRRPRPPRTWVTLLGRPALLVVLAAGFLTMHGFFAVSAGAGTHDVTTVESGGGVHAAEHPVAPAPAPHPADHHDLLAGCVVALVGVVVLSLAHLLARRRPLEVGRLPRTVPRVVSWVGDHAPALPPPRIALCVVRV